MNYRTNTTAVDRYNRTVFTVTALVAVLAATQPAAPVPPNSIRSSASRRHSESTTCIVYVFAPEGKMVNELPAQILPLLTEIVGVVFTETLMTAAFVDKHPGCKFVPVTV